ncbi:EthD family reductase [Peribacillus simplex]|uniref:EthD domain-containing protein n=1 Tax=Peribacillus simplex TaxID=1478 RepID=UPI0037F9DA98
MIASICILRKKEELSIKTFRNHYLEVHGQIVVKIPGLHRYEQYHVGESTQPTGLGDQDYPRNYNQIDAFSKLWFDDLSSMETALKSNVMKELADDGKQFIADLQTVVTKQNIVVPTVSDKGLYKMIQLLKRPSGVSPEKFKHEWCKVHAEMVPDTLPGVLGYTQNLVIDRSIGGKSVSYEELPVDGIVELWFKDKDSMESSFSAPTALKAINHAKIFIEEITTFTTETHRVF